MCDLVYTFFLRIVYLKSRITERRRDPPSTGLHPKWPQWQERAGPKSGAWDSTGVSNLGAGAQVKNLGHLPLLSHVQGAGLEEEHPDHCLHIST